MLSPDAKAIWKSKDGASLMAGLLGVKAVEPDDAATASLLASLADDDGEDLAEDSEWEERKHPRGPGGQFGAGGGGGQAGAEEPTAANYTKAANHAHTLSRNARTKQQHAAAAMAHAAAKKALRNEHFVGRLAQLQQHNAKIEHHRLQHQALSRQENENRRKSDEPLAKDEALVIHPRTPSLAFDRASVRTFDVDGRLHVEVTNISKATVSPYLGSEIPGAEELGLDPRRIYQLLRDPEELEKAASTFNNIPVLSEHIPVSAADHRPDLVVGSTGTDAVFEAPYLKNSLVVWSAEAIKGIENGEQRELSCAYRYTPDMTPGNFDGTRYDGVMRNLIANHLALVATGRAGPDVVVGDSQLSKEPQMKSKPLSRHAMLAKGALIGLVMPRLAADAKIDFNQLLSGIDASNWAGKKQGIVTALRPKLAKDADIADVAKLLDAFDPGSPGTEEAPAAEDPNKLLDAVDADPTEEILAMLRGKVSDEDLAAVGAKLQALLAPAADEFPPKPAAAPPMGVDPDADPNPETDLMKKDPPAMDAVNKIINQAVAKVKADAREAAEAREAVRPYVGSVAVALDSGEAIYRAALDMLGVKTEGVHPSALRAVLEAQPKAGEHRQRIAQDAAPAESFTQRFPGLATK